MVDRLDLPDRYRRQVEALLTEHVPEAEVWAYGSRVNGRSHSASDLDLVLRSPTLDPLPAGCIGRIDEAFEDSNIPILVQTHDWARLPTSFHKEIQQSYVILRNRTHSRHGMHGTSPPATPYGQPSCPPA